VYAQLYVSFGRDTFSLKQALEASRLGEAKLAVAFSKLHSAGVLLVFKRSRPRVYRLLDPRNHLLQLSTPNAGKVKQEEYTQLLYDTLRVMRRAMSITAFAVYGSVSRGEAEPTSDIDILVISESFQGSIASRIDSLAWVEDEVSDEIDMLRKHGLRPFLSFYPMRREEARRLPVLFLDLTEDACILYDEEGFLADVLSRLKAKLLSQGAKRISATGSRYWDLGSRPRELIEA